MRFAGRIGFVYTRETKPGIHEEFHVEKPYTGDVERKSARWQNGSSVNDTLINSGNISVIADKYISENEGAIRYVVWKNSKWAVNSIDPTNYPRIVLELGGIYNG